MTDDQLNRQSSNGRLAVISEEPTLIEELEGSDAGAQEMAAARLAVEVVASLHRAIRESEIPQKRLGELLDLSPGAVSQVVNGDGNLRVVTIGRYFRALGYQARIFLEPVEPDRRVIASRSTCAAIADELRECARMSVSWVTDSSQVSTPPTAIWALPNPDSTDWQHVTLQRSLEGQHVEVCTG